MGGGQGNALTGQFFVINLDPVLKSVEAVFPEVEVKAIQDDMTLMGPPEVVWDRTDDNGVVHKGAEKTKSLRRVGVNENSIGQDLDVVDIDPTWPNTGVRVCIVALRPQGFGLVYVNTCRPPVR